MNTNDLQLWKINQAIPSLNSEINGKNNPLELGLTDLIDFNKVDLVKLSDILDK